MSDIVTTHQLSKRYGDRQVVHDVDLRIPEGVVYGFLGPNGAGKSTTMKMLLSLIRPSSGSIRILGEPMTRENRHRLLGRIGSLIESPPGYGHLTGAENMRIVQHLLGLNDDDVRDAVRTVHLERHIDKKVRAYSLGMKQRLGIAMALVRRPRLLILDEPTNGLDPAGIEEIRDLLQRLAERGTTVMVSSHLLGEIDKTATVLGVLAQGRLVFQGNRSEMLDVTAPDILIDCAAPSRVRIPLLPLPDPRAEVRPRSHQAARDHTGDNCAGHLQPGRPRHRHLQRRPGGADAGKRVHADDARGWHPVTAATRTSTRPRPLRVLRAEYSKMRNLRILPLLLFLLLGAVGIAVLFALGAGVSVDLKAPDGDGWKVLLGGLHAGVCLLAPLLIAVIASRVTEIERAGNGWLLFAASGTTPGQLCRAKFLALGAPLAAVCVLWGLCVPVWGALLGVPAPVPTGRIVAYTASVCVISLVILALQLLISLASDNQLLAVGAGMLGVLLSMIGAMAPTWAQYLTPWTYYSLVAPMTFTGSDPVYLDAPFPGALVLAIAGAVAFTVITTRLDRKEV